MISEPHIPGLKYCSFLFHVSSIHCPIVIRPYVPVMFGGIFGYDLLLSELIPIIVSLFGVLLELWTYVLAIHGVIEVFSDDQVILDLKHS